VEGFFEYRETGASAWDESARQTLTSAVEYEETVTGLPEETTYEWRAVVETPDGQVFRTTTWEDTTTGDPVAETDRADDVGDTSATLVGSLNDLGGADEAQVFFEYGTGGGLSNETPAETLTSSDFNTGGSAVFSHEVTGLSTGETYEFRAVADASDGETAAGSVLSFTPGSGGGGGGGGGETPAIDQFDVTVNTSFWGDSVNVDWAVSDGDGDADLSSITTALRTGSGSVLDSDRTDVSGSEASGSDHHGLWAGGEAVKITVTDADGNETTDVESV
jgi:subtilisin